MTGHERIAANRERMRLKGEQMLAGARPPTPTSLALARCCEVLRGGAPMRGPELLAALGDGLDEGTLATAIKRAIARRLIESTPDGYRLCGGKE